jgi:hypothetical protein
VKALVTTHIETTEIELIIDPETMTIVDSDVEVASLPMSGGDPRTGTWAALTLVLAGALVLGALRRPGSPALRK